MEPETDLSPFLQILEQSQQRDKNEQILTGLFVLHYNVQEI